MFFPFNLLFSIITVLLWFSSLRFHRSHICSFSCQICFYNLYFCVKFFLNHFFYRFLYWVSPLYLLSFYHYVVFLFLSLSLASSCVSNFLILSCIHYVPYNPIDSKFCFQSSWFFLLSAFLSFSNALLILSIPLLSLLAFF